VENPKTCELYALLIAYTSDYYMLILKHRNSICIILFIFIVGELLKALPKGKIHSLLIVNAVVLTYFNWYMCTLKNGKKTILNTILTLYKNLMNTWN